MTITPDDKPRRGRPPKLQSQAAEMAEAAHDPREEIFGKRRENRGWNVHGARLGVAVVLDFVRYAYRWVSDDESKSRVLNMVRYGNWRFVSQDGGAVKADATDGVIRVHVGLLSNGEPEFGYLMCKPREWHEEDQMQKQSDLDAQLQRIRAGNDRHGGAQGDYIPTSGISVSR